MTVLDSCMEAMIVYFGFFGTIFIFFSFAARLLSCSFSWASTHRSPGIFVADTPHHSYKMRALTTYNTHRTQAPRPRQRSNISYFYFNMLKVKRWLWEKRNTEKLVVDRGRAARIFLREPFGCHYACHALFNFHTFKFSFHFSRHILWRLASHAITAACRCVGTSRSCAVYTNTTTISVVEHWKWLNFIFIMNFYGEISSYWEQVPFHSTRSPRIRIINHEKSLFSSFACKFCVQHSKIYAIIAHNDETF